jgi:hypothetical protein
MGSGRRHRARAPREARAQPSQATEESIPTEDSDGPDIECYDHRALCRTLSLSFPQLYLTVTLGDGGILWGPRLDFGWCYCRLDYHECLGRLLTLVCLSLTNSNTISHCFIEELKAEKTLASLESVGSPTATVIRHSPSERRSEREGRTSVIPTEEVVVGDIVIIKM